MKYGPRGRNWNRGRGSGGFRSKRFGGRTRVFNMEGDLHTPKFQNITMRELHGTANLLALNSDPVPAGEVFNEVVISSPRYSGMKRTDGGVVDLGIDGGTAPDDDGIRITDIGASRSSQLYPGKRVPGHDLVILDQENMPPGLTFLIEMKKLVLGSPFADNSRIMYL